MEKGKSEASKLTKLTQAASKKATLIKQRLVSDAKYCFRKWLRNDRHDPEQEKMERERLIALANSELSAIEWAQVQADAVLAYEAWDEISSDSIATLKQRLSAMRRPWIDPEAAHRHLEEADLPDIIIYHDLYNQHLLGIQDDIARDVRSRKTHEAGTRRARHCLRCFNSLRAKEGRPGNLYVYEINYLQHRIDAGESIARILHRCIRINQSIEKETMGLVSRIIDWDPVNTTLMISRAD